MNKDWCVSSAAVIELWALMVGSVSKTKIQCATVNLFILILHFHTRSSSLLCVCVCSLWKQSITPPPCCIHPPFKVLLSGDGDKTTVAQIDLHLQSLHSVCVCVFASDRTVLSSSPSDVIISVSETRKSMASTRTSGRCSCQSRWLMDLSTSGGKG